MAVKRVRKKSTTKKNQEDSEDQISDTVSDSNSFESNQDKIKEVQEYNIYDAETEFKLKEVFSKDNEIVIGPPRLTRFEKARITGARSLQLSLGAPTLSQIPVDLTDTILIAKFELDKKTLPISIRRVLPNGLYQDIPIDWTVK
ncbi:MAG TPA: DNA-directed RNA polymerase subunit K [Candidatus Nitrosocosmicus sp.]|nr:DNA-directed RNA polymerase subunit K [Candidatus Nitrosocosmicus sp.]